MKNYTITVNGSVYDVVVEEGATSGAPAAAAPAAPRAVPKAAPLQLLLQQQAARQAALRSRPARQARSSRSRPMWDRL